MALDDTEPDLAELAEAPDAPPAWAAWLAAHPDAAAEVEAARRARRMMQLLAQSDVVVPADFEARLMARIHGDRTLLDLLDLLVADVGGALVELVNLLLGLAPDASPSAAA